MRLSVDDDLRSVVDHSKAIVALKHSARATHLGAVWTRKVALLLVTSGTLLLWFVQQKFFDLGDLSPVGLELLGVTDDSRRIVLEPIALAMSENDAFSNAFEFLALVIEFAVSPTSALGRIRRQLATIDSEVLFADEAEFRGVEQHVAK
jgi:hypothetical protein